MNRDQLAINYPIDLFDKVMEESGEVLQAMGKYKRFGPDNYSPYDNDQMTNHETLVAELNDLVLACENLIDKLIPDT